jgi:hypothetical protein
VVCCTALLIERGVATTAQMVSAVATDWTAWTTVHLDSSGREFRENGNRNQWDMLQSNPCGLSLTLHCSLSGVWRPCGCDLLRTVAEQCRSEQIVSAVATGLMAWKTVRLDSSGREYRGIGSPNQCDMPQSHSGDRSGSFECESAFDRSKITVVGPVREFL